MLWEGLVMDIKNEIKRIAKENNLTTDEVVRLFLKEIQPDVRDDRIVYNRETGRYHYTKEYDRVRRF